MLHFQLSLSPQYSADISQTLNDKNWEQIMKKHKPTIFTIHLLSAVILLTTASISWSTESNVSALEGSSILQSADRDNHDSNVSPIRRIERRPQHNLNAKQKHLDEPSLDGSGNNVSIETMNQTDTQLRRWLTPEYTDGVQALGGAERPSPRTISNIVNDQEQSIINSKNASDFLWQWGQFLDHDIDLTDGVNPAELANIAIPSGDALFDPDNTGNAEIPFNRSLYDVETGVDNTLPRQQLNEITGWIDASNVYGSDEERAHALRTNDGSGQLKVSAGNLLPFNEEGLENAGGSSNTLFLAGDVRANEQVGLTAMHTLFMREHNRLAQIIATEQPALSGEDIYQRARRIVMSEIQAITFNEFLPILLGRNALRPYKGYKPNVDARIANVFSTAAYRLGHSLLSTQLLRLDQQGNEVSEGHLALRDAFFAPYRLNEGGIDPIMRGLASQACQELDTLIVDDVRNFLFGNPGEGGFDLASLNIQRGRDHGLPSYNNAREKLGLTRLQSFTEISSDVIMQQRLTEAYNTVDDIDLWVGGLAEDKVHNAMVGELFFTILTAQFEALRDGDRFWYQRALNKRWRHYVNESRLSDIIRRNTDISTEIQDNVFIIEKEINKKSNRSKSKRARNT